jgi:hypothetical protein
MHGCGLICGPLIASNPPSIVEEGGEQEPSCRFLSNGSRRCRRRESVLEKHVSASWLSAGLTLQTPSSVLTAHHSACPSRVMAIWQRA